MEWGYTYSLQEFVENTGRPSLHAFLSVTLLGDTPGALNRGLQQRAVEAAGAAFDRFQEESGTRLSKNPRHQIYEARFDEQSWPDLQARLDNLLPAVERGWKARLEAVQAEEPEEA